MTAHKICQYSTQTPAELQMDAASAGDNRYDGSLRHQLVDQIVVLLELCDLLQPAFGDCTHPVLSSKQGTDLHISCSILLTLQQLWILALCEELQAVTHQVRPPTRGSSRPQRLPDAVLVRLCYCGRVQAAQKRPR